jgi:hypothetical protein
MAKSRSPLALLLTLALVLIFASQANAQASRTWVSGDGVAADDANPCTRTAPCRTFIGAISKTAAGGEINAIDAGAFGTVTITKAITIDVSNVQGGVLNSATNGVIINAAATDTVILRGLDIYGGTNPAAVPPACTQYGSSGIKVINAGSVRIENTRIGRQTRGIELVPTRATKVFLNRVELTDNCTHGIVSTPTGPGSVDMAIRDSTISTSGTGLDVADGTTAWLSGSMLFGNALGLQTLGTGVINDFGDNRLVANTVDGTPTNDLSPVAPTGPAGPAGTPGAPGAAGPAGEAAVKLLLATTSSRRAARAGSPVIVNFAATAKASTTLTISRAGRHVTTLRFASRAGSNSVRWNGRVGNARSTAGAYRLVLTAIGPDGQTATATIALTVKRR